ncbi:hypothetical protein PG995_001797 [Apiospora arundinis]|uniref:S-adenosyl-L-methionine-dependent methyltransferase n=1 Tax=Apiospora arundinis TaxID=335852 RepID=A0ABR2J8A1_9PEZI
MGSDEADRDENTRGNRDSGVGDNALYGGSTIRTIETSRTADSEVFHFVEENGRTYHSYKAGRYLQPNDEREQRRESIENQIWLLTMEGKLFLSPIDQVYNILDICTGTGLWAISMAHQFPGARIIGNDLSPITPPRIPSNCQFEVEDVEEFPWVYSHKFDFIHARSVFACFDDLQRVIVEAAASLEDDGWLEIQDWIIPMRCDDGSWDGTAIKRLTDHAMECLHKAGRSIQTDQLPDMFRKAGLVDVKEETILWPMNPWAKGKRNKEAGLLWMELNKEGLESMTLALLTRYGNFTKEEAMELITMARVDLRDTKIHCYLPATIVIGRKAPRRG